MEFLFNEVNYSPAKAFSETYTYLFFSFLFFMYFLVEVLIPAEQNLFMQNFSLIIILSIIYPLSYQKKIPGLVQNYSPC